MLDHRVTPCAVCSLPFEQAVAPTGGRPALICSAACRVNVRKARKAKAYADKAGARHVALIEYRSVAGLPALTA